MVVMLAAMPHTKPADAFRKGDRILVPDRDWVTVESWRYLWERKEKVELAISWDAGSGDRLIFNSGDQLSTS